MKSRSDIQPNAVGAKPIAREPTSAMCRAVQRVQRYADPDILTEEWYAQAWRAMWDAAPSPEGVGLWQAVRGPRGYALPPSQTMVLLHIPLSHAGPVAYGFLDFADHKFKIGSAGIQRWVEPDHPVTHWMPLPKPPGQEGPSEPEGGGA